MTIFNQQRLTQATLQLDLAGIRSGVYSDQYFEHMARLLTTLAAEGYTFGGTSPRLEPSITDGFQVSAATVEMQIFMRRSPFAVVGGVDCALAMLRYFMEQEPCELEIEAVHDGAIVTYNGDPMQVVPVLKIRGEYRHFAVLETPILGYLTRISRIATNVYHTLIAAQGKPVLFFPARFDLPGVQAADGYAYWLGVQRYNADTDKQVTPFVSTHAQGAWWGGKGSGTTPHAVIANFLADTAEAMVQYARTQPPTVPRIALVDFENDCVHTSLKVAARMFAEYCQYWTRGEHETAERFQLTGVRLDTGGTQIDASLTPTGDPALDFGVNPLLVRAVREALDHAWQSVDAEWQDLARAYYAKIRIVATGGFTSEKIARFEAEGVPVDIYGVGSSLLTNDKVTNTDFTADVVRVKIGEIWRAMAKVGRQPCDNPALMPITFPAPRFATIPQKYASIEDLLRAELVTKEDANTASLISQLAPIRERGYFTKTEFLAMCKWKESRERRRRDWQANTEEEVIAISRQALSEMDDARKMETLDSLKGVGIPVGSAILALIYPETYGVIDIRVWQVLYAYGEVDNDASGTYLTLPHWLTYLTKLRAWAEVVGVSARMVELTLFEHHKRVFTGKLYAE